MVVLTGTEDEQLNPYTNAVQDTALTSDMFLTTELSPLAKRALDKNISSAVLNPDVLMRPPVQDTVRGFIQKLRDPNIDHKERFQITPTKLVIDDLRGLVQELSTFKESLKAAKSGNEVSENDIAKNIKLV